MSRPIRVGVIGAGGWGQNHVRTFASLAGAELTHVCDTSEDARGRATELAPEASVVDDAEQLFGDAALEAIVIASDASTHAELATRAMRAGKDVFVEKPLALDPRDAEALRDLSREKERVLMVGHLLLYHPAITRLHELVQEGRLGRLLHLHSERQNLGVLRRHENAWYSLAPHDLSIAHLLFGAEPESVVAQGACLVDVPGDVEDVVHAWLRYADGRVAQVASSWLDPAKTRRLTLVGTRAMAVFDDMLSEAKLTLHDADLSVPPDAGAAVRFARGPMEVVPLSFRSPLELECEAFLDSVRTREAPLADAQSGVAVVRALDAGQRSLRAGGTPVSLTRPEDQP
ncbi:MAG: Gfo/Idh/MocA family oxidoreductase [Deltaproteobacteria bacterium]|nr:Gfo/Idh/MocA family oxidoreductase [Deltaproteobacteria bacterium]